MIKYYRVNFMKITFFQDIINVWYSDAHRVSVFFAAFCIPLFCMFFRYYVSFFVQKIKSIQKFNFPKIFFTFFPELFFILSVLSYLIGLAGLFQIVLTWTVDAIVRGCGLAFLAVGLVGFIAFAKTHPTLYGFDHERLGFYKFSRHPYFTLLLCIALGMSLSTVSVLGGLLCVMLFASVFVSVPYIDKSLCLEDEFFIDYKYAAPSVIPNIVTIMQFIFK